MTAAPAPRQDGVLRRAAGFCATALLVVLAACADPAPAPSSPPEDRGPFVVVLGVAQDAGYPQAGCRRSCCRPAWEDPARRRRVVSLAVVDPSSSRRWLLDASPDLPEQLHELDALAPTADSPGLHGIFLTHGHVGHYTGLMHLGREVMGARGVPVHVMPRMASFLQNAGPWEQLVRLENIRLHPMEDGRPVVLTAGLSVTPFLVPHRDEYTETVGFRIDGPERSVLYLPDIDKWQRWERSIEELLADVDVAYVDGSFFAGGELPGRDMSEIPHPFVVESMERWSGLPADVRSRVRFLHLNHTNPLLEPSSDASEQLRAAGFRVARQSERIDL
jgi:pyrroloquinoline quinone biosynthesis protein B